VARQLSARPASIPSRIAAEVLDPPSSARSLIDHGKEDVRADVT